VARTERLVTHAAMDEPLALSLASGQVVLYSTGAPGRSAANEDAILVVEVDGRRGVIAIADGVGGQPDGENASDRALASLSLALEAAEEDGASLLPAILDGFEAANRAVLDLGTGAATTLIVVEILDSSIRVYHVGDAAAVVVGQRGRLKLQTVQHSPVGYAVESGMLDEDEALHHEERHLVSNLVGDREMRVEVGSPRGLAIRDTAIVASDGLFDNLEISEIADLARKGPLDECSRRLAQSAGERMRSSGGHPSKPDDLSFALFRLTGSVH